jgi:mono/diheme cytochrome c family protein
MKKFIIFIIAVFFYLSTSVMATGPKPGEVIYNKHCAKCHGKKGTGTVIGLGPPLVHKIYEPNHHGDASFHMAVTRGVRAHHWTFGDMRPIEGVSRAEVDKIIIYIRALQREKGIY